MLIRATIQEGNILSLVDSTLLYVSMDAERKIMNIYKQQKDLFGRVLQVDLFGEIESDKEIISTKEEILIVHSDEATLFVNQTSIKF